MSTEEVVKVEDEQLTIPVEDTVSVAELMAERKKAQEAEAERARLKAELEAFKKAKLKEAQDFKTLYEQSEKDKAEVAEREATWKTFYEQDKKMGELRSQALASGIRKEALSMLDSMPFEEVIIEKTTTGRINVLGADKAIARLKANMPFLFEQKSVKINAETPSAATGSDGKTDMKKIRKLQEEYKKSPTRENGEALKRAYMEFDRTT